MSGAEAKAAAEINQEGVTTENNEPIGAALSTPSNTKTTLSK